MTRSRATFLTGETWLPRATVKLRLHLLWVGSGHRGQSSERVLRAAPLMKLTALALPIALSVIRHSAALLVPSKRVAPRRGDGPARHRHGEVRGRPLCRKAYLRRSGPVLGQG